MGCVTGKEKRLCGILHCSFALFVRNDETWPLVPQIFRRYIRSWNCFSFLVTTKHGDLFLSLACTSAELSGSAANGTARSLPHPGSPGPGSGVGAWRRGAGKGEDHRQAQLAPAQNGQDQRCAHSRSRRGTYPGRWGGISSLVTKSERHFVIADMVIVCITFDCSRDFD